MTIKFFMFRLICYDKIFLSRRKFFSVRTFLTIPFWTFFCPFLTFQNTFHFLKPFFFSSCVGKNFSPFFQKFKNFPSLCSVSALSFSKYSFIHPYSFVHLFLLLHSEFLHAKYFRPGLRGVFDVPTDICFEQ